MKRAIFRKIVKLFKVEKFNKSSAICNVTFIESLKEQMASAPKQRGKLVTYPTISKEMKKITSPGSISFN